MSSYNYVQNNPLLRIDPTGAIDTLPTGKNTKQNDVLTFKKLWNKYPSKKIEHIDPKTGKELFPSLCAINVSHALSENDVKVGGIKCWACKDGGIHSIRAESLAKWFKEKQN